MTLGVFINSKPMQTMGDLFAAGKNPPAVLVITALVCALVPLDASHLFVAASGALLFAIVQASLKSSPRPTTVTREPSCSPDPLQHSNCDRTREPRRQLSRPAKSDQPDSQSRCESLKISSFAAEVRKPSSMPVVAPTFVCTQWDAQVAELVERITPKRQSDMIVQRLVHFVQQTVRSIVPEVQVVGFASADFVRRTAFGVAVPEVDIVVTAKPKVLLDRFRQQGRLGGGPTRVVDLRKVQKAAIRVFTDKLVSSAGFKFRRSAFRSDEPKVTLLAPSLLGLVDDSLAIDFSVNTTTPLHNAMLITECGRLEPRARDLILLVRRWAKDRAVCHAAKGHLSPYTWTLLTIYFLQVGVEGEGALLPTFDEMKVSSGLDGGTPPLLGPPTCALRAKTPVSILLKEFMSFYHTKFDWREEAVSVRLGRRCKPSLNLPLHIVTQGDVGPSEIGPSIEDPFDTSHNMGSCLTLATLARLRQELARANDCCQRAVSLTEFLEPWVPPDREE